MPLFQEQIKNGGPITVTHPEISRYFMTIPEAAQLVIQAGALASGGDVFVLDMGKPIKILDLACNMARLSGLNPNVGEDTPLSNGSIEVRITGLRKGEKLFEELVHDGNLIATSHPRILRAADQGINGDELKDIITKIEAAIRNNDHTAIIKIIGTLETGVSKEYEHTDILASATA